MFPTQRAASPLGHLFNYHLFAHGRLFYRYYGSEACRFSPQAAFRLLSHLAADNARPTTLWDPFCGTGFILSVAGCFFPQAFPVLLGSDVQPEAVRCAARNLALFTDAAAFSARRRELEMCMRPSPKHRLRWGEVAAYFDRLGAAVDFSTPSYRFATFIADAATARRPEQDLTIFADLPYGRSSTLVGAVDYLACLAPLLKAHPQLRGLFIAPASASAGFQELGLQSGRSLRLRGFKGGRLGASFAPVASQLVPLAGTLPPADRTQVRLGYHPLVDGIWDGHGLI